MSHRVCGNKFINWRAEVGTKILCGTNGSFLAKFCASPRAK
jgi:hypothetical protein